MPRELVTARAPRCIIAGRLREIGRLALMSVAVLLFSAPPSAKAADAITRVEQGRIAGEVNERLRIYRGIPFASPPVGQLRWRPPEPPEQWDGVRDATKFAEACIQTPNPVMNVPTQPVSEDCLYLNVWTPADAADDSLAVLVWIHGGGFNFGSTAMPLFDGAALARRGVVVVSTAYRLGAIGFLAHPALSRESPQGVSGNYGLLDQIAALRWVRENIAAFGGDPDRVTIMGESAGAASVSMLVQSPLARGLFHGAIAQSGGSFMGRGTMSGQLRDAEQAGLRLAAKLGAATAGDLRGLSADDVLNASQEAAGTRPLSTRPVQDGHVLADDPVEVYRQNRQNDVPVLMGSNDREGDFFARGTTLSDFRQSVTDDFGDRADDVFAAYPASNDVEAVRSAADLAGDRMFGIQHWTWARLQSRYGESPIFYYHFDQNPPRRDGIPPGPIHGAELPYVFGTMSIRPIAWTDADRSTSELLMTYWTNFVKSGNPSGESVTPWPAFSEESPRVMYFRDGKSELGPVPHEARLAVFDPLDPDAD